MEVVVVMQAVVEELEVLEKLPDPYQVVILLHRLLEVYQHLPYQQQVIPLL